MFKALLKTRMLYFFSAMVRGKSGKKGLTVGKIVLIVLLYVYLMLVFGILFGSLFASVAVPFYTQGISWMYFAIYALISFAIMLFGSSALAKTQLFDAKDNDLLLSMPIPPRIILLSRISFLVIVNLFYQLVVSVPAALAWGIFIGFKISEFVRFVVITLLLILFSTALSLFLGWLIALASSRAKNKTLISVLFTLAFLAVYFYFYSSAQKYVMMLAQNGEEIASGMKKVLPLYWLGKAVADGNAAYFALSSAIMLIPFIIALAILSRTFLKIVSASKAAVKVKSKKVRYEQTSADKALLRRDVARLFSSSAYLLNSGVGIVFSIFAAGFIAVKGRDIMSSLGEGADMGRLVIAVLMIFAAAFMIGMILFTSASISIEGKTLWILKSLPVKASRILWSKLKLHIIAAAPVGIAMWLAVNVSFYVNWAFAVYSLLIIASYVFLTAGIGLAENINHPILDWDNEAVAVKSGVSVLFTMLLNMALAIAPIVLVLALTMIDLWLTLAIWFVLMAAANAGVYVWLMTIGAKRFMEL